MGRSRDISNSTGPSFAAYADTVQTLTTSVSAKVQCNVEVFDTDSCYDNTTNYRFTPNKSGIYQLNVTARFQATGNQFTLWIMKNGATYITLEDHYHSPTQPVYNFSGSVLVQANGSTDYFELFVRQVGGATLQANSTSGPASSHFSGSFVKPV